jgi:hypothetical protein
MAMVADDGNGRWWWQQNGWQDSGTMAMCGIPIAMDSGGGDGQLQRDGNLMGEDNGHVIAMGNGGGGAMDGGTVGQLQWQWVAAERGQRNGRRPFCGIIFPLEPVHLAVVGEGSRLLMRVEREVAPSKCPG